MLTNKEKEVIELSRRLSNSIMELPEQLESDREDVLSKLRDIQAIVMSREAVRNNPDMFTIGEYGGKTSDFDKKKEEGKMAFEILRDNCKYCYSKDSCGERNNLASRCGKLRCPIFNKMIKNKEQDE